MRREDFFQIAIDGPTAAGKGTIATRLALKLGFLYVDTGAMYRMAGLLAARHGIAISSATEAEIVAVVAKAEFVLENIQENNGLLKTKCFLDGQEITDEIRTMEGGKRASQVAELPLVREILVAKQQAMAASANVVMEGRDIGKRVLPDAQLKFYLTAEFAERARRRFEQIKDNEPGLTIEIVKEGLEKRDFHDTNRAADPLTVVPDALILDTTELTIEEVVDDIVFLVKKHQESREKAKGYLV